MLPALCAGPCGIVLLCSAPSGSMSNVLRSEDEVLKSRRVRSRRRLRVDQSTRRILFIPVLAILMTNNLSTFDRFEPDIVYKQAACPWNKLVRNAITYSLSTCSKAWHLVQLENHSIRRLLPQQQPRHPLRSIQQLIWTLVPTSVDPIQYS